MAEKTDITTIKLSKETKLRLEKLRIYKRETYDELIQKTLEILNICKINSEKAQARLKDLDRQKREKQVK